MNIIYPFGYPVVPDVYKIYKGSSPVIGTGSTGEANFIAVW